MKIRNQILIYFSCTVTGLSALSFFLIYFLFSEYREEEFQQQQKEKITYTIRLLAHYKEISEELASIMDELTIHDFYDEKMLVFDEQKNLLFSSIDDLSIAKQNEILEDLSPDSPWIETKEGNYDIVGIHLVFNQKSYYSICKAYDAFGYSKMYFLKNVLIGIFIAITFFVIFISLFLSNKISKPITELAEKLKGIDLNNQHQQQLTPETSTQELELLTERFNELMGRANKAFFFQKHTIHHISHELKTPIAVLVSELERISGSSNVEYIRRELEDQINKAKSLGDIINVLLEISKIETGQQLQKDDVRIDELIFDILAELKSIFPEFIFEINYVEEDIDDSKLVVNANKMLIKQAFVNLFTNCISYSDNQSAEIILDCSVQDQLSISIINSGTPLSNEDKKFLFYHFFRGENSRGKIGFGLGLVLTHKIMVLHSGTITYTNTTDNLNIFELRLPLS